MARIPRRKISSLVHLSPAAVQDRLEIRAYTARKWGKEQANEYLRFLRSETIRLAKSPDLATLVTGSNGIRCFTVFWNNTRYGHRIFFEETPDGIVVLRILHTSMNWPEHLKN